ncbi:MAG: hypothetical protein CMJ83_04650 [Planctomycetes bacterium]|nr:hypothetical protein [Planctomycetota bacterium]
MSSPSHPTPALDCVQFRRLIPLHVGGDLSDAGQHPFDHHASGCGDCTEHLAGYRAQCGLLSTYGRDLESGRRTPDLWSSIERKLDHRWRP